MVIVGEMAASYQVKLTEKKYGKIATEMVDVSVAGPFYYAEDYHQQYLDKQPGGYCGLRGTGAVCPI